MNLGIWKGYKTPFPVREDFTKRLQILEYMQGSPWGKHLAQMLEAFLQNLIFILHDLSISFPYCLAKLLVKLFYIFYYIRVIDHPPLVLRKAIPLPILYEVHASPLKN